MRYEFMVHAVIWESLIAERRQPKPAPLWFEMREG